MDILSVLWKVGEVGMSESRPKKRKVEFIESYWTGGELGSDYQWNDNHGELVRCKDCKHATMTSDGQMCKYCEMDTDDFGDQRDVYHDADWFCADGERKG